jgi:hypothetical protein
VAEVPISILLLIMDTGWLVFLAGKTYFCYSNSSLGALRAFVVNVKLLPCNGLCFSSRLHSFPVNKSVSHAMAAFVFFVP